MTLYIDLFFFTNFAADGLILAAAKLLCGGRKSRWRLPCAAAVGGLYAAAACIPALGWLGWFPLRLLAGVGLCALAFGFGRQLVRQTLVFFALSALFAGLMLALSLVCGGAVRLYRGFSCVNIDAGVFVLSFAASFLLLRLLRPVLRSAMKRRALCRCELRLGASAAVFSALLDTGCMLTAGPAGEPLLLLGRGALPDTMRDELSSRPPLLVSCRGFSGAGETLFAFAPDSLTVDGALRRDALAAFCDGASGVGFDAIIGPRQ